MLIYFWMRNAPPEIASYQVTFRGSWGEVVRSGFLPETYENFIDAGSPGTISVTGWDASWNRVPGGSGSYTGLKERAIYNIDFRTGSISLEEAPAEEKPRPTKEGMKILVAFLPWPPLTGPPLPMGFFPPWPLSIGNWMAIPGYPKLVPD